MAVIHPRIMRSLAVSAPVVRILAVLLLVLAVLMVVPLIVLTLEGDPDRMAFLLSIAVVAGAALTMLLITRGVEILLRPRQMFILTTLSWVLVSACASLPLILGAPQLSFTDAVFESISAITTTGSTVLVGIDDLSDGLKLWRGLMQWLGGIGIIVMAIAILPFLKVGGMRLFQTESSDWSDKVLPRAGGIAKASGAIYLGGTLLAMLTYWLAGMTPLDAVVHAMSSMATGGFANSDASFGVYQDRPLILWLASFFMLCGALPFVLFIRALRDTPQVLWQDQQVRGLLGLLLVVILGLTLYRVVGGVAFFEALTQVAFNVISVVTTTGYASDDYTQWGPLIVAAFFYLTFVGGCSGSTSGGMKIFRFQIGAIMLFTQLRHLVHAQGVFAQRYNGNPLSDEVVRGVIAFSFFFFLTIAGLALGLALLGLDLVTALSGAATAVANVGPGLGPIIGPAGNFAPLPDAAKWLLSLGMLMGRLEILTVLVLLTPTFWRK
ncbi:MULTISPECIES: TrkH family potassium uptake protein [Chromohalobacter]|uniref:TrkH family potassium uptake protein n=1 Tax=Chromohalobacter TaxID=42054 RepID=UPI0015C418CE|nr:TrkH family potassium uptake protein [Chromohalobacter salexigens]MDO0946333.1 TrkH family potassium uptake protein [Chromohalobacter salexigens]NWO56924.1 potassium transporter TrkH [Chromohalobacter salexigens]